jgi:hypothetical protein
MKMILNPIEPILKGGIIMQRCVWMNGVIIVIIILLLGTSVLPSITAIRSKVDTTDNTLNNTIYYDMVIGFISSFQDSGTNVSFMSIFTIWIIHPVGNFTSFETMTIKWVSIQNIISKTGIITNNFIIAQFIHDS